ncbi:RNB domain-containing ribonuclease [cf. Phormidesmis sp. LEGE 11477]|uniref:RNB domain-containing ribonuclease n=1 Tax=cf. Phormidesmis sp. LEGE 11477 TaxID=1828680 RepID=UPI00187E1120|nr:RNB domain-containing ribonuclease [cf. Phormidesmis sp. LEGE 11477]MBE9064095.1 RNB domain-containing ribonuclease [cf. Phormidesmis sp. LEGE 11477]
MAITPTSATPLKEAWSAAITEAAALTLPDSLWQRPQVQGLTIDGPTSKDLDDAIHLEPTPTGGIASIHIADVSELVTVGTTLDKVALARTRTRYLSRGNIPMLPPALSEDKLSLLEGQPRPTLTIQVTLNHQAEIEATDIFESWIVSAKRFTYEQVDQACQSPTHPFYEQLQQCQTWAERLNHERRNQGAIGGQFNAAGFWIDENGTVLVSKGKLFRAQMIIQEFMILANRAVAHWFAKRDVLALYRNHTARTIAPERQQIMQALLTTGNMELIRKKLQNWLNKAEYSPILVGHFALNLTAYCHFTSPIRRLPDLLNHRIIKALIHDQPHPYRKFELEQLCTYIATLSQQEEAETKAFFKQRHQRSYQKQIQSSEATTLAALSTKAFDNLVKHAAKENNFEPILAAAQLRLKQNELSIQSLYLLLIHSKDLTLQRQILAALEQRLADATSVLVMATDQEDSWEQLTYVEASEDTPPFSLWVEVAIAGEVVTTHTPAQSQRKQSARHSACLTWLEAFVFDKLVSPAQRQPSEPPAITPPETAIAPTKDETAPTQAEDNQPKDTEPVQMTTPTDHPTLNYPLEGEQNFVGLLQELSQSLGWAMPAYQFTQAGSDFICTCTAPVQEQDFTAKATATQKKKAKQEAARGMLVQLQRWFHHGERIGIEEPEAPAATAVEEQTSQPERASAPISHPLLMKQLKDGQNFIGFLQQLCQTLVWDFPEYEFEGETPEFICTCTVCADGQRFSGEATASKKKRAKYLASKVVLLTLQQHFQSNKATEKEA